MVAIAPTGRFTKVMMSMRHAIAAGREQYIVRGDHILFALLVTYSGGRHVRQACLMFVF